MSLFFSPYSGCSFFFYTLILVLKIRQNRHRALELKRKAATGKPESKGALLFSIGSGY